MAESALTPGDLRAFHDRVIDSHTRLAGIFSNIASSALNATALPDGDLPTLFRNLAERENVMRDQWMVVRDVMVNTFASSVTPTAVGLSTSVCLPLTTATGTSVDEEHGSEEVEAVLFSGRRNGEQSRTKRTPPKKPKKAKKVKNVLSQPASNENSSNVNKRPQKQSVKQSGTEPQKKSEKPKSSKEVPVAQTENSQEKGRTKAEKKKAKFEREKKQREERRQKKAEKQRAHLERERKQKEQNAIRETQNGTKQPEIKPSQKADGNDTAQKRKEKRARFKASREAKKAAAKVIQLPLPSMVQPEEEDEESSSTRGVDNMIIKQEPIE